MNLFEFYIPEEILVALSLLVLMFVLTRVFWKPLMKVIDNRQTSVDDMLQSAEDAKKIISQMEEQRASHDEELGRQAALIVKEARDFAAREHDRIIAEANEKAHKLEEAGEDKARRAFEQSICESREAIIALALEAASKVVESSMDSEKNRGLIENILKKAGAGNEEAGVGNEEAGASHEEAGTGYD